MHEKRHFAVLFNAVYYLICTILHHILLVIDEEKYKTNSIISMQWIRTWYL